MIIGRAGRTAAEQVAAGEAEGYRFRFGIA
jgi:hypothetical protein